VGRTLIHKTVMASLQQIEGSTQIQASPFERLSDDILRLILDLAMARDSPFYITDPRLGLDRITYEWGRPDQPQHDRSLQPVHRVDWIAVTSTSHRTRAIGKVSFFTMKTFAIHRDVPARLQRSEPNAIKGMMLDDQALALRYIRDIIIVDPGENSPSTFLVLPQSIAAFSNLRRCTLLFRFFRNSFDGAIDVEWVTKAFISSAPVHFKMQEYMIGIGMPRHFILEEAMGPGRDRQDHQDLMEEHVYPVLRFKSRSLEAKRQKERSAAS
jgi:hypothetical protein